MQQIIYTPLMQSKYAKPSTNKKSTGLTLEPRTEAGIKGNIEMTSLKEFRKLDCIGCDAPFTTMNARNMLFCDDCLRKARTK